jgi:uncharacterized protein (DUF1499 family)
MNQQRTIRIILSIAALLLASACATPPPAQSAGSAAIDSRLTCSLPTNCVNSRTSSGLAPLHFAGTAAQGLALLQATLASFSEATVQTEDKTTVKAVFTTPAGFRDDVMFLIDPKQQTIDFQSHSGFGLYDFGKNRSRMQAFAERFNTIAASTKPK